MKHLSLRRIAAGLTLSSVLFGGNVKAVAAEETKYLRPPAVPLVTFNPFLSIWSEADHLTDNATRHWTRREHSLVSLIRIDGTPYRLMGNNPATVSALPQVGLKVTPTRSIYEFEDAHVHVSLTFMTVALPHDLEVFGRPLSYITWQVRAIDGRPHAVSIYDSTSSQLAVNRPNEPVTWARETMGTLTALRIGTQEQPILGSSGDDHRINWGYAYTVAPSSQTKSATGADETLVSAFVQSGQLPATDDTRMPRAVNDDQPVMAFVFDLGNVESQPVSRHLMVGYDEIYAIKYYGKKLVPYWRRNGASPSDMFQAAERDYASLVQRCEAFDQELMADLTKAGGTRYAQIAALAYRQAIAACGFAADSNKQPLFFTKENTSNGDIATVDVFYPMDPILLLFSPTLSKASLVHILMYSATPHWRFPNAPHDLGTYPFVTGRDDGGEGMPVEESGNMILLCDAIAQSEGNANFVSPWWPQLTQWAQYFERYGLDPENQLCTDDFMGHLAHNANLSVKAILGLAAYGDLCKMRGDSSNAEKYFNLAKTDAQHWVQVANDGDHYRLAFDKTNTWSQKYNLVWDRILGLNIFPPSVAQQEIAYYKKVLKPYGVPLDSRTTLTKTDWCIWTATMTENTADFDAIVSPIWDYLNETTTRDPLSDSYRTDNVRSGGMHARPVVGGIFMKMLADRAVWKKWASRDTTKVSTWAPLPEPPQITEVVPTSRRSPANWRYTTERPGSDWFKPEFDASAWKEGPAGFGTSGTPGAVVNTRWNSADIWLRREFTMPAGEHPGLQFYVYHDEDVDIYVNGILAASESGFVGGYTPIEIRPAARALLRPDAKITLAVHCHQTGGGQDIDVGLADVVDRNQ